MEFCLGDESVLAGDLHDARVKWYFIGGHLKIKDSDLKAIEAEYPKLERRLLEMIVVWLKRAEPSTCEELLAALMMSNVNEEQLARKLSEKYNCQLPAPGMSVIDSLPNSQFTLLHSQLYLSQFKNHKQEFLQTLPKVHKNIYAVLYLQLDLYYIMMHLLH